MIFLNISGDNPAEKLLAYSSAGYDDVFILAAIPSLCELGSKILGHDGCMNFFSGPTDRNFSASLNYYDVHYNSAHILGTTGGNTSDLLESLQMSATGILNPAVMITHIGGLDVAAKTTLNQPNIPGGKKTDLHAYQYASYSY